MRREGTLVPASEGATGDVAFLLLKTITRIAAVTIVAAKTKYRFLSQNSSVKIDRTGVGVVIVRLGPLLLRLLVLSAASTLKVYVLSGFRPVTSSS